MQSVERRTRLGLSADWLNSDFKQSSSYSGQLVAVSKYYRTFNQVLDVRIVDDKYLIAMKLKSFRHIKMTSRISSDYYRIVHSPMKKYALLWRDYMEKITV